MPKQAPLRQTIGFLSFGIYLYHIAKWRNNKMVVTDIKIRKYFNDGPMKAVVSVTFDSALAVHDIKVINAKDKFFIVMPSRKNPDGTYRDIVHPINSEFRAELEGAVIKAYFDGLENAVFEDAASAEI
jgi:stage V sporulation protein G